MKKYDNYVSALETLKLAPEQDLDNEFVQGGVIAKFSIQFELGWKLFKELLAYEGDAAADTGSPRDVIKAAYRCYDFMDEEIWLEMLRSRNETARIYDSTATRRLVDTIIDAYIPEFVRVQEGLEARYSAMLDE